MSVKLLHGDCRQVLRTLPDASVHCCVTSPPYFGLRDYGVDGQIGLEPTPAEYVDHYGTHTAHQEYECLRLLHAEIARLRGLVYDEAVRGLTC